jgi:hypothetical protein
MTRSTRDLCQDCWQAANPDQYCPDLNRYGTCAQCGADALVTRSAVIPAHICLDRLPGEIECGVCGKTRTPEEAGPVPFEDCGPVVNPDGTPTAFTLAMFRRS